MAKEWVHVEGLSECLDALEELPKAVGTIAVTKTLTEAAQPIAVDAEIQAPRRKGTLKLSITVSKRLSKRQRSLNKKESPIEVYAGAGPLAQATAQEFGNAHNRPQPFMRPAWANGKITALNYIKTNLGRLIDEAAQRLARKSAKYAQSK